MPVIEYKLVKTKEGNEVPSYVKNGGHWRNPRDYSMVGWVDPKPRKYYVPDTIVELNDLDFVQRMLEIHSITPFMHDVGDDALGLEDPDAIEYMDSADVSSTAMDWYHNFVEQNS